MSEEFYEKCFTNINRTTSVVKLRDFQYRLLHNRIFCNDKLVYWGKVHSNICDFCDVRQDIMHLMYHCGTVRTVWNQIQALFRREKLDCMINLHNIMFNRVHKDVKHITNTIVLIVKQFIYRCKCQKVKPTFAEVKAEITLNYLVEIHNSHRSKNYNVERVTLKWSPVLSCFNISS